MHIYSHAGPWCPRVSWKEANRGCCHRVRHPFLTQVTCSLRSGRSTSALQTATHSFSVADSCRDRPVGGSQACPACSHGTPGSEAVGCLALVPRSSSRSDLPAGQPEALRPGRGPGERGGSCRHTLGQQVGAWGDWQ